MSVSSRLKIRPLHKNFHFLPDLLLAVPRAGFSLAKLSQAIVASFVYSYGLSMVSNLKYGRLPYGAYFVSSCNLIDLSTLLCFVSIFICAFEVGHSAHLL